MIKISKDLEGKKVLVRSYEAGVYFGTLEDMEGDMVRLSNARNIWHWSGASCLSQIANDGIKGGEVSPAVSSLMLTRVCQVMLLSENAIDNLEGQPAWIF